jgi:hypothetical protein
MRVKRAFVCRDCDGGQGETSMPTTQDRSVPETLQVLLDALLNSWDRNNTILVNLLRAVAAP